MEKPTIFKLRDPDTKEVMLIGITDRSKSATIGAIMRDGSITKKANELIQKWVKEGKTPIIELTESTVGKNSTKIAIMDLSAIFKATVMMETVFDEEELEEIELAEQARLEAENRKK